jgi:AcrR family transcriptional regulator
MVRRPRSQESKLRAIRLTAAAIDQLGEPAVRLTDLADRVGVVQVTLLRWFGNLQNLLDAAQLHRFENAVAVLAPWLPVALAEARDRDDLRQALDIAIEDALTSEGQAQRAVLANILSISLHRPSLAERLWPRLTHLRSELSASLREAQGRGLLAPALDPDAVAVMLRAHLFGLLVIDLHPPLTPEAAQAVADELRQGAHLTLLQEAAPERGERTVAIGRVTQPLRSPEVDLDDIGERLLTEAVRLIDRAGESAARVQAVVRAVGVNASQLHRRFGDVQSLVVLAQAKRLVGLMMQDVKTLQASSLAPERDGLAAVMAKLSREIVSDHRRQTRRQRLSALGASFQRPELQAVAAAVHVNYFRRHVRALTAIRRTHDLPFHPFRLSVFTTVTLFGIVLADAEFEPPAVSPLVGLTHDLWMRMLRAAENGNARPLSVDGSYEDATVEPIPTMLAPLNSLAPRNATSDAIVAAAEQLFRSDGPLAATPVRIAQLAQVNDATISYYFRTREHLHLALLQKASDERQVRLRQALGTLAHASDEAWLAGLLAWWEREALEESTAALWRQLRALGACDSHLADAIGAADAALVGQIAVEFRVPRDHPRMRAFAQAWEALQLLMLGIHGLLPSHPEGARLRSLALRLGAPAVAELRALLLELRTVR